jgi:hypothetical protein
VQTATATATDFDDAVLGIGLPPEVTQALQEAGAARGAPVLAMSALMRACSLAPEHPAVLIAFYRYYFYGHRLRMARAVSRRALVVGARSLGLPVLWRDVPEQALAGAADDVATRFYLWVLKGYAYLSLRLDDPAEARDALAKLRALDPEDHVGAALLEAVRQRHERHERQCVAGGVDDEADDGPALPVFGAAAWARVAGPANRSGAA